MAVTEGLSSVAVNVLLNNGTSNGKVKTLTVSLSGLSTANYDNQKVMNIVSLLGDCLSKPVYSVKKVSVATLSESD